MLNEPIGVLAHLQIGRAYAMQADTAKARNPYQDFLTFPEGRTYLVPTITILSTRTSSRPFTPDLRKTPTPTGVSVTLPT